SGIVRGAARDCFMATRLRRIGALILFALAIFAASPMLRATSAVCNIDGTQYSAGTVNPANPCQVCNPSSSTTSWSNEPNGTTCDDGNACTQFDACLNGVCSG